jgi:hypothetical protein
VREACEALPTRLPRFAANEQRNFLMAPAHDDSGTPHV